MNNKHVAVIGVRAFPARYPGISGVDVRMETIISHFSSRKYVVDVYVRSWIQKRKRVDKNISVIPVFTFNHPFFDTLIYGFLSSLFVCFSSAQTVFYEGTGSFLFCFLPRLFGKKIIVTIHSLEWKRKKWNRIAQIIIKHIEGMGVFMANTIVVVSNGLRLYCQKKYKKESVVIPYFINRNKRKKSFIKILKTLGVTENKYVLYLGRFTPEKRIEWIIRAHSKVDDSSYQLLLVGFVPKTNTYSSTLKDRIQECPYIQILPYVFGETKKALLASSRFIVLASEIEGFPIILTEALGYHKPILFPALSGVEDLPLPQQNVFHPHSYQDFERKYLQLLKKPKRVSLSAYRNLPSKTIFTQIYESLV